MKNETPEELAERWFQIVSADNVVFVSHDMKGAFLSGWFNAMERCKDAWDDGYRAGQGAKETENKNT